MLRPTTRATWKAYLEKTARKDKVGDFTADDLLFFVDASLSYDLSED